MFPPTPDGRREEDERHRNPGPEEILPRAVRAGRAEHDRTGGAIYGFIGENSSGKSATEKMICGLLVPDGGSIRLFGKDYRNDQVRFKIGVLVEAPGCFPNLSVWNNMQIQAANLDIRNPGKEIAKVLKTVRMEGAASNKFKNCSLGMKQRIGIAMALLFRTPV
ncbi:MAG: ATP-binding cassette domain-containing protein [Clostridia bacterium]|nr:ATP-binding cassette domain-containing protein [Clostridia bacterium]